MEKDEAEVTPGEFRRRMVLESPSFHPDGDFDSRTLMATFGTRS